MYEYGVLEGDLPVVEDDYSRNWTSIDGTACSVDDHRCWYFVSFSLGVVVGWVIKKMVS